MISLVLVLRQSGENFPVSSLELNLDVTIKSSKTVHSLLISNYIRKKYYAALIQRVSTDDGLQLLVHQSPTSINVYKRNYLLFRDNGWFST